MVLHGIGQQHPFDVLDSFAQGLRDTLEADGYRLVTVTHRRHEEGDAFDHSIVVQASRGSPKPPRRLEIYEYWLTVTGFVVVPGNTTSGAQIDPVGFAGAATPPTVVIWSVGALESVTNVGGPELTEVPAAPVKVTESVFVYPSTRTRPALPLLPTVEL
jgi:hypothetical protein